MEETAENSPQFSFTSFFFYSWLYNLLFLAAFVAVFIWCASGYQQLEETRTRFLVNIGVMPVAVTHSVLLLIFSVRRFMRGNHLAGGIFFLQCLATSALVYNFYALIVTAVFSTGFNLL
ncbi:MAG TPA: hypothetical protein VI731_08825 [Bacteroidia bacterium]|nr:hypothetical protein [Bacteroidia bacterium]